MNDITKITGDIPQTIAEPAKTANKQGGSFDTALKDALKEVSDVQNDAEKAIEDFSKGNVQDIHTVVIAMEKADVHMQTLLQVRNKLLTAYNSIMSMQV
ncbi:MAG: flagellar hook-basal body complex protein FliE [Nitrospirae bacterium]|nr:flagellar hook-basal body complex protein FliE [Nitrospirota bacterium]